MNMQATTARLSIMVTPDIKRRLQNEAKAKKTTVGDVVRRRLDGELDNEEHLFMKTLADLGRRARSAIAALEATRVELEQDSLAWAEHEADIRKNTLAGLTECDRAALAALLPPAPTQGMQP